MKHSLRHTLADSHIAAIAIAVLFLFALRESGALLSHLLSDLVDSVAEAIAASDLAALRGAYQLLTVPIMLSVSLIVVFMVLASVVAACLLSYWVYGAGPFRGLRRYYTESARRKNA